MELNKYQEQAMTTCMKSSENLSYMLLNLVGEVGEFSSKIAKYIRKGDVQIDENQSSIEYLNPAEDELLRKEAGDILWQLAGLCKVCGWSLEEVASENLAKLAASENLAKLAARQTRGVIEGNGDNR